jgi:hypothetical protein
MPRMMGGNILNRATGLLAWRLPFPAVATVLSLLTGAIGPAASADPWVSNGVTLLSSAGSDRASRYNSSNKIITYNGKTHVAWLDAVSKTMIATYSHATATWSAPVHVGDGIDNHGGPALTIDGDGYLHIVYGPHGTPFHYAKSAAPNDSSSWVNQGDFSLATYPSLVCDSSNTLHLVYRYHIGAAAKLGYQRKPAGGAWSSPLILAEAETNYSGYTHYHQDVAITTNDVLHVAYDIYQGTHALRLRHMMSTDRGLTWRQADGTVLTLPIRPDAGGAVAEATNFTDVVSLACDSLGNPWFTARRDGLHELYHYDGTNWQVSQPLTLIPPALGTLAIKEMPMAMDSSDRIYILAALGESVTGGVKGDVYTFVSTNGGISYQALYVFPSDTTYPHTGLNPERATGHNTVEEPWFLFSTGPKSPPPHDVRVVQLSRVSQQVPGLIGDNDWFVGITTESTARRLAPNGACIEDFTGLPEVRGIDYGPDGNIYIADNGNEIGQFAGSNLQTRATIVSNTTVDGPMQVRFGPHGNLYCIDSSLAVPNRIKRWAGPLAGSPFTYEGAFTASRTDLIGMQDFEFGPDGDIYVSNWKTPGVSPNPSIEHFNGTSGAWIKSTIPTNDPNLDNVRGIAFGPDGNLYVANYPAAAAPAGEILRYQGPDGASPGTFIDIFVTNGSGGLDLPQDIEFGSDSNLYVCSYWSTNVLRYQGPAGGAPGAFVDEFSVFSGNPLFITQVPPPPDRDRDGMPDDWEVQYFGSTTVSGGGPDEDRDGDGFRDVYEFGAGTNPTNRHSLLVISDAWSNNACFVITWQSVSNRTYDVHSSTNAAGPWILSASNIVGTPPQNVHTAKVFEARRYFRTGVVD